MSLSKHVLCHFCAKSNGIYSCPRCNYKYCSLECYKDRRHENCSEKFFQEWVETTVRHEAFQESDQQKVLEMIKKCTKADDENIVEDQQPIEDRFADIDLNTAGEKEIWEKLTAEEQNQFKSLLKDKHELAGMIPHKQPWWTATKINLVTEINEGTDEPCDIEDHPPVPINIKHLSSLTSIAPSDCVRYNMINILYSYVFLYRTYNNDLREFTEDVVDLFFVLSPVLSKGMNYLSFEEAVQDSIRLVTDSQFKPAMDCAKSVVGDICDILRGPTNSRSETYVLCTLHDIQLLILERKNMRKKSTSIDAKKLISLSVKKLDYLISWTLDHADKLKGVASKLALMFLPDMLFNINEAPPSIAVKSPEPKSKSLIEELN